MERSAHGGPRLLGACTDRVRRAVPGCRAHEHGACHGSAGADHGRCNPGTGTNGGALGAQAPLERPSDGEKTFLSARRQFLSRGSGAALTWTAVDMTLSVAGDDFGGRGMLRVAAWTAGLFALGGGICQLFPGPFVEPLVLLGLGTALFFVSGRTSPAARGEEPPPDDAVSTTRAAR